MTDDEVAQELIRRGLILPQQLIWKTVREVAVDKGWCTSADILYRSLYDVLKEKGIL